MAQYQISTSAAEYLNELARSAQKYRTELHNESDELSYRLKELERGFIPSEFKSTLPQVAAEYRTLLQQSTRILTLLGITDIKTIEMYVSLAVKEDPEGISGRHFFSVL